MLTVVVTERILVPVIRHNGDDDHETKWNSYCIEHSELGREHQQQRQQKQLSFLLLGQRNETTETRKRKKCPCFHRSSRRRANGEVKVVIKCRCLCLTTISFGSLLLMQHTGFVNRKNLIRHCIVGDISPKCTTDRHVKNDNEMTIKGNKNNTKISL